jgi:hypothetical protein
MMVDDVNEVPNHQIIARAREKMTLRGWNTVFARARMTVQAAIAPCDLTVRTPEQMQMVRSFACCRTRHCMMK